MALDFSWLGYYMSFFGFMLVFLVMYSILAKTKILGDSSFMNFFVSFIFAIIFVAFSPGIDYVQTVLPWFSILIICLFMVLILIGFSQKKMDDFMKPWLAWVAIVILVIIFLISAIVVFNPVIKPYLPGQSSASGDTFLLVVVGFIYSEKFLGAVLLIIIAAATSWIIAKGK